MRRVVVYGLLALASLATCLMLAVLWLPGLLIRAGLGLAGLQAEVEEVAIGPFETELRGIELGVAGHDRLRRLRIRYSPTGLIAGRLASVEFDGAWSSRSSSPRTTCARPTAPWTPDRSGSLQVAGCRMSRCGPKAPTWQSSWR